MKTLFSRPSFYIWLVLAMVPVHTLVTIYAFNMNTAAWIEIGRMMGSGEGGDLEASDRFARIGYQYHKAVFVFFGLEVVALLGVIISIWKSKRY